jgi:CheY-like chemotaxis protein
MSDGTIFRFRAHASTAATVSASAFHHAALDADASARLAAMDRAFTEVDQAETDQLESEQAEAVQKSARPAPETADPQTQANESATAAFTDEIDINDPLAILTQTIEAPAPSAASGIAPEIEVVQAASSHCASGQSSSPSTPEQSAPAREELANETSDAPAEVTGIFAAASVATEIMHQHSAAPEQTAEETSLVDAITDAIKLDAESEPSALATLEVAPILDASGELQPGVDDYTPPAPFEIHVPESLTLTEMPVADIPVATASETTALPSEVPCEENLSETFDLDSLCAPTEAEQIIDKAIAQEEAVAEMNAAAEEFVAEQIASDAHTDTRTDALTGHAPATAIAASSSATQESEATAPAVSPLETAAAALKAEPSSDRRRKRRALISAPIRVRSIDVTTSGPDEIATTVDVSRYGILFYTVLDTYQRGMDVAVVFPYHKSATGAQTEQFGRVVRLHDMQDGRHAVAISLGVGIGEHLVDASGRKLGGAEPVQISNPTAPQVKKPLVLMADSDTLLRDTMKIYLQNEGYEVIAVSNANDAREVLNMFMPAMIVAEIEGEGDVLPGLDLCAHVKSSPSLKRIPVVLTSRSAYPSDYSNAHSLGAVVCMAKPYKPERLGHIVRLLAPLPEHLQSTATHRMPDPTRGFRSDCNVASRSNNASNGAPRNGAKKSPTTGTTTKNRFKFPSFR